MRVRELVRESARELVSKLAMGAHLEEGRECGILVFDRFLKIVLRTLRWHARPVGMRWLVSPEDTV